MSPSISKLALVAVSATALFLPACAAEPEEDPQAPLVADESSSPTTEGALTFTKPADDPFYVPPAGFEATAPGTILKSRNVSTITFAVLTKSAQMLVRSTDTKGNPIAVVTTVIVPLTPYLFLGKRPLVSYQAAIDSLGDQCNPSYQLQNGLSLEMPLISSVLLNNWAVVTTDYQGPKNALGASVLAAHAVLDGIRAAESLPNTGLAGKDTPVGMWGYSGGAFATAMAAQVQPSYAPELKVKGVALGGTPVDPKVVAQGQNGGLLAGGFLAPVLGITREYPELLPLLNDKGKAQLQANGDKCILGLMFSYPLGRFEDLTTVADPWSDPLLNSVWAENTAGAAAPTAPVFMYHSIVDELAPFQGAKDLQADWCGRGAKVQFEPMVTGEHILLLLTGAPRAVQWLGNRFLGLPALPNCPR